MPEDIQAQLAELERRIEEIEKLLFQVKWTIIGGVLVFAVDTIGLKEIIIKALS